MLFRSASVKALINSCSFFNNKAENLIKIAKSVMSEFDGEIPATEKELMSLAGVGQKTAHVVLIEHFGSNLMAVDTHVFRVTHRLGLSRGKTPETVELDLTKAFKTQLNTLHQAMVPFGRYTCKAVKPNCKECFLNEHVADRPLYIVRNLYTCHLLLPLYRFLCVSLL